MRSSPIVGFLSAVTAAACVVFSVVAGAQVTLPQQADLRFHSGAAIAEVTLPAAGGGATPYQYTLTGNLHGLVFTAATRVLSGTPTVTTTPVTLTYSVTDSTPTTPLTASQTFTLHVQPPPSLQSPADPGFTVNQPELLALPAASGGFAPFTYDVAAAFPRGVRFDAAARAVIGVPAAPGVFTLTYGVTDNLGGDSGRATRTFTLSVLGENENAATLAQLAVLGGSPQSALVMTPRFDRLNGGPYKISSAAEGNLATLVDSAIDTLHLRMAATDANATIRVNARDVTTTLTAGNDVQVSLPFSTGATPISIEVTPPQGAARVYTLSAQRAATTPGAVTIENILIGDTFLVAVLNEAENDGGSSINQYKVQVKLGSADAANFLNWTEFGDSLSRSIQIAQLNGNPLVNGTAYDLRAYAVNDSGEGAFGATSPATPQSGVLQFRAQPGTLKMHAGLDSARQNVTLPQAQGGTGTIAYSISGLPPGVTMDANRILGGTPTAPADPADPADTDFIVTYTATDETTPTSLSVSVAFRIEIAPTPEFASAPADVTVNFGEAAEITLPALRYAIDPKYAISGQPDWLTSAGSTLTSANNCSVNRGGVSGNILCLATRVLTGTPDATGTHTLRYHAGENEHTPFSLYAGLTDTFTLTVNAVPPSPPRNVRAVPGDAEIAVSWDAPASTGGVDIKHYLVRQKLAGAGSYTDAATVLASAAFTHTIPSLSNGGAYDIQVVAVNTADTEGAASAPVRAIPFSPTARLQSLQLSGAVLQQAFAPQVQTYSARADNNTAAIGITATAAQPSGVTLQIDGAAATLGVESQVTLDIGANEIVVAVTSGQTTLNYTLNVTRAALGFDPALVASREWFQNTPLREALPLARGGTAPYAYTLTPALPSGVSFDSNANAPAIFGAPTALAARAQYVYTATDSANPPVAQALTFSARVLSRQVPSAPGAPVFDSSRTTALSIRVTAPADAGLAAVERFVARYRYLIGDTAISGWNTLPATAIGVVAVTPTGSGGVKYEVQAAVENAFGRSAWGPSASATTSATPQPAPGVVEDTELQITRSQLTLSWTPLTDPNNPITNHRVRWSKDGGATWLNEFGEYGVILGANASSHSVAAAAGGDWHMEVAAVRAQAIIGAFSESPPYILPDNLALKADRWRKLTLSWDAPQSGAATRSYRVRFARGADSQTWLGLGGNAAGNAVAAGAVTYTTPELDANTHYHVQIAALQDAATGIWSGVSAPTLKRPGAPADVTAARAGKNAIAVTWAAPADTGNGEISDYRVRWALGSSPLNYLNSGGADGVGAGAVLQYTLSGLTPLTTYAVEVAARNSATDTPSQSVQTQSAWQAASAVTGFDVNVNAAAGVTTADAIIIARHLMGVDGASLLQGQAATADAQTASAISTNLAKARALGFLSFDAEADAAEDWRDGVLLVRYLLGMRGAELTADVTADEPAAIVTAIEKLLE